MPHRSRSLVLALGAAAALLTGCSGSPAPAAAPRPSPVPVSDLVSPAALSAGCQPVAGPLNVVHRQVATLTNAMAEGDTRPAVAARAPLAAVTTALQALAAPAGATGDPVQARAGDLVQAVGFLRLGIDTHSLSPAVLGRADDAARSLAAACGA